MPTLEKMTLQEFEALRPLLGRLALDTVDIARAVLVEGVKPAEAATRNQMSRQRVHGIVQRFRAAARQVPATWRRVEVWLPPELAAQVEAIAAKARDDHAAGIPHGKKAVQAESAGAAGADPLHAAAEG